jgi:hypothetical protein
LSLALACAACPAAPAAGPPPSETFLGNLVRELGNDNFERRREAAARLRGCMAAVPLLEEAGLSDDAEVSSAARELLRPFEPSRARSACRRLGLLLGEGRFDLLPEHAMRWGPPGPEEYCFEAASFAGNLCRSHALARLEGITRRSLREELEGDIPLGSWRGPSRRGKPWQTLFSEAIDTRLGTHAQFAARSIKVRGGKGVFLSTGGFRCFEGAMYDSIVIANDDVTVEGNGSANNIIICDGSVSLPTVYNSIVIARKGIQITGKRSRGDVLTSCGKIVVPAEGKKTHLIQEDAKFPLGLVHFFGVADVGLALDALTVKAVSPDCSLALAGLLKGDAFLFVDGKATKTPDELRRALRRRYAIDGVGIFEVERGGKRLTLRARLAE